MKNILSLLLALSMLASFATVSVSATDVDVESLDFYAADGVIVSASDATEPVDIAACVASISGLIHAPVARNTTIDLSNGPASIDWDLSAESSLYSSDYFKTNTQKIKVHLKSDTSVSLTVKLYNNNGNLIGTYTKDVGTILGTDYTFSSLTASQTYYLQIINNGQRDVNITGTVSQ